MIFRDAPPGCDKCEPTQCQPLNHTVITAPAGLELVYNKLQVTRLSTLVFFDPNPNVKERQRDRNTTRP